MTHRSKTRNRAVILSERLEQRRLLSAGLAITYASSSSDVSGLATLSYNGTQLINESNSNQEFQVDRYYTYQNGVYTNVAGGTGFTHSWNATTDTLTYSYSWGTLTCQYVLVNANRFNMVFSVNNSATSGVTLGGIDIYPAYIHFPYTIIPTDEQQIANNPSPATPLWSPEVAYGSDGPAVVPADYSNAPTNNGAVMDLVNDGPATQQMYTALWTEGGTTPPNDGKDYFLIAATAPTTDMLNNQANSPQTYTAPIFYTNTAPGQSDHFQISLRFGAAGTPTASLATDIEQNYAAAYPNLVNWPDRRPIASLHIASYGQNVGSNYNNSIGNPNSFSLGGNQNPSQINVTTTAGLNAFSAGLLSYASNAISEMSQNHAQGMIVWDLEGEQYAQPNPSYIGDPRLATTIAPELNFNYDGNGPIVNQFFSAFTKAGFRVGMTLRPTQVVYTAGANPPYSQTPNGGVGSVDQATEVAQLEAKIAYAYSTWGATLFYVDSTTGYDSAALRIVQAAYPNVLLIPEHNTVSTFGTGAAYGELTNDYVGTPSNVYATYPGAFSVIYIADGNMSNYASELINSLKNGDIMLFRAWFADPNDPSMISDYQTALPTPGQTTATAVGGDAVVNLAWQALGNEAVYNIARSTSPNGTYTTIASGVFGSSYADTTVTNYNTYYYEITAVNGAGTGPASSPVSAMPGGPVIVNPATSSPTVVTGTTAALSVSATDQGGGTLKYVWSEVATPANVPPPTFSVNGTYQASNTTVSFYQSGTYVFTATVTDSQGYSTTSTVTVPVSQTTTVMYVLPAKVTVQGNATQQYSLYATDQFSDKITAPAATWSVSGGGTINSSGLFTANQSGGTYVVTAISGSVTATTTVLVQPTAPAIVQMSALSTTVGASDIGTGSLIVPDAGTAGLSAVTAEIKDGENIGVGYWNGSTGIVSSAAAADSTHLTAVGVILNNDGNASPLYNTFNGASTSLNDVLVKYTYYGDANLDGTVDGSDYSRIDFGYLTHAAGWYNGDFNYDGVIDGSDYTLMDNAFNRQSGRIGGVSTPAASIASQLTARPATAIASSTSTGSPLFNSTPIAGTQSESSILDLLEKLQRGSSDHSGTTLFGE